MSFKANKASFLEMPPVCTTAHLTSLHDFLQTPLPLRPTKEVLLNSQILGMNSSHVSQGWPSSIVPPGSQEKCRSIWNSGISLLLVFKDDVWSSPAAKIFPEHSLRTAEPKAANWTGTGLYRHQLRCSFPLALPPQLNPTCPKTHSSSQS